jgi:hypothetical protein
MKVDFGEEQSGLSALIGGAAGIFTACAVRTLGKLGRTADRTTSAVEGIYNSVEQKLREFGQACKEKLGSLWIVPAGILVHAVISQFVEVPLLPILAASALAKMFGKEAWRIVNKHLGAQAQAGVEEAAGAGALICSLVCLATIPTKNASIAAGELLKRMGNLERGRDGFEFFFKNALKYFEGAVNKVLSLFTDRRVDWLDATERFATAFCNDVDAFEALTKGPSEVTVEQCNDAVQLQMRGIGLKKTLHDPRILAKVERAISRLTTLLLPYQGAMTAARNYRAEPVFVCLYGGSAVGKTTLVTKLACAILVKSGLTPAKFALINLWQKGTTEFWNGYCNQKCLVMDDCFQLLPVKGADDNEYINVIRMVGNWAYALNFADIESKGKFYFDTPLVVGTTNCSSIANMAGNVVTCPEAVVRRIKHPYELCVTEGYRTEEGTLDYARIEREFNDNLTKLREEGNAASEAFLDAYPWDAWYLRSHNYTDGTCTGPMRSVRDLIEEVVQDLVTSAERHKAGLENLAYFLEGLEGEVTEQAGPSTPREGIRLFPIPNQHAEEGVSQVFSDDEDDDFPPLERAYYPGHRYGGSPQVSSMERQMGNDATAAHFARLLDEREEEEIDWTECSHARRAKEIQRDTRKWFENFAAKHPLLIQGLAIGLNVLIFRFIYVTMKGIFCFVKDLVGSIFGQRGKPRKARTESNIKPPGAVPKKIFFSHTVREESHAVDHVHDLIYANAFGMYLEYELETPVKAGQVQFIEGQLAMQPAHYTKWIKERVAAGRFSMDQMVTFVSPVSDMKFQLTVQQYLAMDRTDVPNHDIEFLRFPRGSFTTAKKITQFLLTDEQYQGVIRAALPVRLDIYEEKEVKGKRIRNRRTMHAESFQYCKELSVQGNLREDLLAYTMATELGFCGAPLTITSNRNWGGRCYLGLHVAGSEGLFSRRGYSTIITLELVNKVKKSMNIGSDNLVDDLKERGVDIHEATYEEQVGLVGPDKPVQGSFTYLGTLSKPVNLSPTSKLHLSKIGEAQPFGPNPQRPAMLRPFADANGNIIKPMAVGLRAYTTPLVYLPPSSIELAVDLATRPFREASLPHTRCIFNFREAVCGVEGLKIKSITRSTSPGYPYIVEHKNGKKDFFGYDAEFDLTSEACGELRARVDHIISEAAKGVRLGHLFTDFLKDETRPHAKVDIGATRIISAAPLDYVVAFRMYFGAFMAAMFRYHTESGMCPGINPYNEWFMLATKLCSKGKKVFDGDHKRFDANEQPGVHWAILEFINSWYGNEPLDNRIRAVLFMDLIHSRHVTGDGVHQKHVVQWNKSLPSGHPGTTIINSLYSLITLTGCYIHLTGDSRDMWNSVYLATFGDDNIVNVSDEVADVFNQVTVADAMRDLYALEYTPGSKQGELVPYTTLDNCTFLKRTFVCDAEGSGGWVAPLDPASFLYTSYYYRNPRDVTGEMRKALEDMFGELSLHSVDFWDKWFPVGRDLLRESGTDSVYTSRAGYRAYMKARIDAWF